MTSSSRGGLLAAAAVLVIGVVLVIQNETVRRAVLGPGVPSRTTWGDPDLMGVWQGERLGATPSHDTFNLIALERLYRPEARARAAQLSANDDPTLRCLPVAFPRGAALGWPIQIVQRPGMVFVFNEAFHTHRIIPTDGRTHAEEDYLIPLFQGDSIGRWEDGTLVVDAISFNGETWLAGGEDKPTNDSRGVWPTSDAMHVVERWRMVDADTLEYKAKVEDPQMLMTPWETPTITLQRMDAATIEEAKCLVDDPSTSPASYLAQFGRGGSNQ